MRWIAEPIRRVGKQVAEAPVKSYTKPIDIEDIGAGNVVLATGDS